MPQDRKEATPDGQLELKKRARRRLVGAAALALLAAIVLPMVMDQEPHPPAQDVEVRIPAQSGGGLASRMLPGKPAATPLPPAEPEGKPETNPEAAPEPKPEAGPEPKAEARPVPGAKEAVKPPETARPPEKAAARAEEARALAALAGAESAGWVVQLGAYKEEGRVKNLLAKLKEMRLAAYTEQVDTPQGPRTRVRAGPFPTREAAEQAQARARRIGVDGSVAPKQ